MNARTLQLTAAAALVLGAVSCKKENLSETLERGSAKAIYVNGTASSFADLIAGQNIVAGTLNLDDIDTDNNGLPDALEVTYNAGTGWSLDAIHLWVGTTSPPMNRGGQPVPGHYPYKASNIQAGTYTVTIPFSDFGYACDQANHIYLVSAHAELRNTTTDQTEGAWGDGVRLTTKGSWARTTTIEIACDRPPTSNATDKLEAFAKGSASICFQALTAAPCSFGSTTQWGWTNGPFNEGTYTMDLFASAVNCIGGTDVGNVTVVYANGSATITVTMQGTAPNANNPYSLDGVWLHVGATPTPIITNGNDAGKCTIDDKKFGVRSNGMNNAASWTTTVNGLSGEIYVSLGAKVDGFPKHN
jgi:hypothetical protein